MRRWFPRRCLSERMLEMTTSYSTCESPEEKRRRLMNQFYQRMIDIGLGGTLPEPQRLSKTGGG